MRIIPIALIIVILTLGSTLAQEDKKTADLSEEDIEIIQNLEILKDLEMLESMDLLNDYEAIKEMEKLEPQGEVNENEKKNN